MNLTVVLWITTLSRKSNQIFEQETQFVGIF